MVRKGKSLLKKKCPNWLAVILGLVTLLRIPSLFEPFAYGDEMIYLALGNAVRQGVPLYSGIHDNKPPLLYLAAGLAGNVFWFRLMLAAWSLITIVLFYKLAKAFFPKKLGLQKIATIIFAVLTTIPLLEGNIANSEVFMVGFTIAGFLILLTRKLSPKNLIIAGLMFSIASLFKIPAAFDFPVIIVFWLITIKKLNLKSIKKIAINTFYLTLGFLVPIIITFIWYYFAGSLWEYTVAAYLQNVGYLSSFRPGDVQEPFLAKNLPLLSRGAVVLVGISILAVFRKKLSKQFIFLCVWTLFSLFAVTLSERPYPHYLIQLAPVISIFYAMLFTLKTLEQSLVVIPLFLIFLAPVSFRFWHYPTSAYYARFVNYALGNINQKGYIESFGSNVYRNYEVAKFISTISKESDKLYVWGDNAGLYALTRKLPPIRYVADYHISDFSSKSEIVEKLENNPPEIIVIHPEAPEYPELEALLFNNYILVKEIEGSQIWKHTNLKAISM